MCKIMHEIVGLTSADLGLFLQTTLPGPRMSTNYATNGALRRTITEWNRLPVSLAEAGSLGTFKSQLSSPRAVELRQLCTVWHSIDIHISAHARALGYQTPLAAFRICSVIVITLILHKSQTSLKRPPIGLAGMVASARPCWRHRLPG